MILSLTFNCFSPQPNFLNSPSSQHFSETKTSKASKTSSPADESWHFKGCLYQHWARKIQEMLEKNRCRNSIRTFKKLARVLSIHSAKTSHESLKFGRRLLRGIKKKIIVVKTLRFHHKSPHTSVFMIQFSKVWSSFILRHKSSLTWLNRTTPIIQKVLNTLKLVLTNYLSSLNQRSRDIRKTEVLMGTKIDMSIMIWTASGVWRK